MIPTKVFLMIAAFLGMLAVIIGAFGAHGLEKLLTPSALERYHTGVEYQFYHVTALLAAGLLTRHLSSAWLVLSGNLFIVGIVLFSGSLYVYALTNISWLGMITPFGGLAFIGGWLSLLIGVAKSD